MALPVKTGESGLLPFVVSFTVCLVAQVVAICMSIEVLQRTQVLMKAKYGEIGDEGSSVLSKGPSLHDVGYFYLWPPFAVVFDVLIYLQ